MPGQVVFADPVFRTQLRVDGPSTRPLRMPQTPLRHAELILRRSRRFGAPDGQRSVIEHEVADRCATRRAAVHDFLPPPLYDFLRKIARAELGNWHHDPVQQHAVRSCVDPFCACCQFVSCWAGIEKPSLWLPRSAEAQWIHRETYETVDSGEDAE